MASTQVIGSVHSKRINERDEAREIFEKASTQRFSRDKRRLSSHEWVAWYAQEK